MNSERIKIFIEKHEKLAKIIVVIAITLLALFLRINVAVNDPTECDEKIYMRAAMFYARNIRAENWQAVINSEYNYEHPAFYKLVYSTVLLLKQMPVQDTDLSPTIQITSLPQYKFIRVLGLRLVSVIFGTLAILLLAMVNPLGGLMLAIHTFSMKYTSIIYLESLPLFLSLVSVVTFSKFMGLVEREGRFTPKSLGWGAVSAIALGVAVASKYIYGVAGLSIGIYALIVAVRRKQSKWLIVMGGWAVVAGLSFLIANPTLWPNPVDNFLRTMTFHVDNTGGAADYPIWQPLKWLAIPITQQSGYEKYRPFFVIPENYPFPFDSLILVLAVAGLHRLWKDKPLYFIWLILDFAFLFIWQNKWPQYVMLVLPPYCLSAGLGIEAVVMFVRHCWQKYSNS